MECLSEQIELPGPAASPKRTAFSSPPLCVPTVRTVSLFTTVTQIPLLPTAIKYCDLNELTESRSLTTYSHLDITYGSFLM